MTQARRVLLLPSEPPASENPAEVTAMWYPLTRPESSWWSVGQQEMEAWLEQVRTQLTEYDDTLTRKFIEQITVVDAETIRV